MNFALTQKQEDVKKLVANFVQDEVAAGVAQRDEDENFEPTYKLLRRLGDLGLLGLPYPKEYGGAGGDYVSYALAGFELNKVDASLGVSYSVHISLGTWPIFEYGNEEQKQKYAVPLIKGEKIGAFALTEPNAGSDSGASECTAVLDGDHYILNGTKIFCTNASYADTYVVFAMTDKSKGVKGISAFIVEKDYEGFQFVKEEKKCGIRASIQCEILMENVRVPKENLLGKEGLGFKIAMTTLDGGRIGIAAQGAGIAEGAYEYSRDYTKERIQFGKPIAKQQHIGFKLAEMATDVEIAKLMVLRAAEDKDAHRPYTVSAAQAKLIATDTAMKTTVDAVQLMGGHGFLRDHPVERMMRDAKITQIYEGTNEIQKLVISGAVLR
ncbi:MAG: acyl-CoA dehydrogenase family protein [Firmicutes bacterium]|jgi:alkylation response protein AidB-like acyl-CoA dehydrogenase|nr:acyl-CoA dehydrogenase family protein [Bacillota bacterium]